MDPNPAAGRIGVVITGVTQDEPLYGLGQGDSSPDAVVQSGEPSDSIMLRAESHSRR